MVRTCWELWMPISAQPEGWRHLNPLDRVELSAQEAIINALHPLDNPHFNAQYHTTKVSNLHVLNDKKLPRTSLMDKIRDHMEKTMRHRTECIDWRHDRQQLAGNRQQGKYQLFSKIKWIVSKDKYIEWTISVPGASAWIMKALLAWMRSLGSDISVETIVRHYINSVGGKKNIRLHTDARSRVEPKGEDISPHIVHICGCAHCLNAASKPNEYGLSSEDSLALLTQIGKLIKQWATVEELQGDHNEEWLLILSNWQHGSYHSWIDQSWKEHQYFVYHRSLAYSSILAASYLIVGSLSKKRFTAINSALLTRFEISVETDYSQDRKRKCFSIEYTTILLAKHILQTLESHLETTVNHLDPVWKLPIYNIQLRNQATNREISSEVTIQLINSLSSI